MPSMTVLLHDGFNESACSITSAISYRYHFYQKRDFPRDDIARIIQQHLSIVNGEIAGADTIIPGLSPPRREGRSPGSSLPLTGWDKGEGKHVLIKKDKRVNVSLIIDGEKKICVKQFLYPRPWDRIKEGFRTSRGLKAWIGGNGLAARGVPSILLFAYVEKRNWFGAIEGFLLMEAPEDAREMDRYILGGFGDVQSKRCFIETFARWLANLHENNIYHRDMKACNILVSKHGETWKFLLLDLDDIILDMRVGANELSRNLLQLNTSTPRQMMRTDRLRFFKSYHERRPVVGNRKGFLSRIVRKSRARGMDYT